MEFVTIHDLSREFNTPARVIRYRLINLIAGGWLHEGEDFRRDDFKDNQHFVWKINPLSFMRQTGLKPLTKPLLVNQSDNNLATLVNKPESVVKESVIHPSTTVNEPTKVDNHSDNKTVNQPSLEREIIDLLKEQIKVKDGQLQEQGEQLKDLNDLNVKLTGTMLQQNQKIENLLRLTGGKSDATGREERSVNQTPDIAKAA